MGHTVHQQGTRGLTWPLLRTLPARLPLDLHSQILDGEEGVVMATCASEASPDWDGTSLVMPQLDEIRFRSCLSPLDMHILEPVTWGRQIVAGFSGTSGPPVPTTGGLTLGFAWERDCTRST